MPAFGHPVTRLRWVIVVFWVGAAVLTTTSLPSVQDAKSDSLGDLVATDAKAIQTEIRSAELFKFPLLSRTIVVQRLAEGLAPGVFQRQISNVARLISGSDPDLAGIRFALPVTNALGKPPFARERSTTALTYLFFPPETGPSGRAKLAHRYAERNLSRPDDSYVGVTGVAPARAEQTALISDALRKVELATILLVSLTMAIHFRAPGASLRNLAAIAISYIVSDRLLSGIGGAIGIVVPAEVEPVLVALVFGVVTDYTIFYLSRFRARLALGEEAREAASATTSELLPIIGVAGLTVAAATATLAFARLGFFQAFGPGLALSVLVALAVSTTFVPAVLAIAGRRLFWPAGSSPKPISFARGARMREAFGRVRVALLEAPSKRPKLVAIASAAPLVALALAVTGLEVGNRTITGLPSDSEAHQAYRQAADGFAPGVLSPTVVVVEGSGIAQQRPKLTKLQDEISARSGVATVIGPRQKVSPFRFGAVYSRTGDAVRYFVVLKWAPYGARAIGVVSRLEDQLPSMLRDAGLGQDVSASLAGDTAISAETVETSRSDIVRVVPAATLVVLVILIGFLGALVAPLYLVALSLLALAAALGLTVLVFQDLLGYGELAFYVPFAATVLFVALGSDYNVYLVGRIWNEARNRPLREAVAVAGAHAAGAITTAGLVLAASFAMVAIIPLQPFRELAFAVSAGLLIDAFIVRSLLAPALITLVGDRSGWPGHRLEQRAEVFAPEEDVKAAASQSRGAK
ncbi:MMPL family transporter [soil metagenome]